MSSLNAIEQTTGKLVYLDPLTLIENRNNPRSSLGDPDELTESIREVGVLEPLIVGPSEVGGFMVMLATVAELPRLKPEWRLSHVWFFPSTSAARPRVTGHHPDDQLRLGAAANDRLGHAAPSTVSTPLLL